MADIFRCSKCGSVLTRAIEPLLDRKLLVEEDGSEHVPVGFYAVSDGEFFTGSEGVCLVNLSDAIGTKHHLKLGRLNGCCGLDGCDGPNTLCDNGHEIGTEKSDCWMPHALLLDPGAVRREAAG